MIIVRQKFPHGLKFSKSGYTEKLGIYEVKSKFIHQCLKMTVINKSKWPLKIPKNQENCKVEKVSESEYVLSGGMCFIETDDRTFFDMAYSIDSKCLENYKSEVKYVSDISFATSFYKAADASGHSTDLEHLSLKEMNFYKTPKSNVPLTTAMSFNTPRWPSQFSSHIYPSGLEIEENFDEIKLNLKIFASSHCKEGKEDLNNCDFRSAFGVEASLIDMQNNNLLAMDYLGSVIPGSWQGVIPINPLNILYNPFVEGNKYLLSMKLNFPDTYFRLAIKNLKNFLISGIKKKNKIIGLDGLPELDGLPSFGDMEEMPEVAPIPGLEEYVDSDLLDYDDPLHTLLSYMSLPGWPPYYISICHPLLSNCHEIYSDKNDHKIEIEFTILENNEVKIEKVRQISKTFGNYDVVSPDLPKVNCL